MTSALRLVFWETTKACNLSCRHCRAVPRRTLGPTELNTRRALTLIDRDRRGGQAGPRPVGRRAAVPPGSSSTSPAYGVETGFRMALATNGTLVTERVAAKIADTGFARVAISLDGAQAVTHDAFRNLPGSHSLAIRGIRHLRGCAITQSGARNPDTPWRTRTPGKPAACPKLLPASPTWQALRKTNEKRGTRAEPAGARAGSSLPSARRSA